MASWLRLLFPNLSTPRIFFSVALGPSPPLLFNPPLAHTPPERTQNANEYQINESQQKFERYDFLSAGMGALAVTSYCVWRGQDPVTALSITAASTVVALVANELLVEAERKGQEEK